MLAWVRPRLDLVLENLPEAMKVTLYVLGAEIPNAKTELATMYDNSFIDQLGQAGFYQQVAQQYPKAPTR